MMFEFALKMFIGLATKCMSLNNKHCKTRPFLSDLNPLKLKYYLFIITLNKGNGIFNTLSEIPGKICVSNETKDVNLNVFNS